jgi:hypothetical protein
MRRRISLIAGTAILVVSAGAGVSWWYFDGGHQPVEKLSYLHGQPLESVIARLGKPDRQLEYKMAKSPGGEFRVELYNTYPPGDANAAEARIKELQWHRTRYHIAVWLHKVDDRWVVLNTCRWMEGIVF